MTGFKKSLSVCKLSLSDRDKTLPKQGEIWKQAVTKKLIKAPFQSLLMEKMMTWLKKSGKSQIFFLC